MVMLSHFLRFRFFDDRAASARLVDVVVDLAAGDYPPVSRLAIKSELRQTRTLAWEQVKSIDWRRRRIFVHDLRAAHEAALDRSVLAKRDIMDALVVDVERRHTLRANDLWFREENCQLWLAGADASPWAVLRRLGHGLLGRGAGRQLLDWKDLEFLRGDPRAASEGRDYHRQITRLAPAEIARLLDGLPYLHAAELLTLIDDPIAADTLEAMTRERQAQVIQVLDKDQAAQLLALMAPDLAADLLSAVSPDAARLLIGGVPQERRALILDLLRYPDDTAGGIMTNLLVRVPADMRIGDARRDLKPRICAPDFAAYLYVVDNDENRQLLGVVTLRDFSVADEWQEVAGLMNSHVSSIDVLAPAEQAARRVAELHLAALPVTGRTGRLLGAVTVDAAMTQLAPSTWRDQAPRIFS
jgi:CBS domain-containing protein